MLGLPSSSCEFCGLRSSHYVNMYSYESFKVSFRSHVQLGGLKHVSILIVIV